MSQLLIATGPKPLRALISLVALFATKFAPLKPALAQNSGYIERPRLVR
jgi:hypothetical protein